MVRRWIYFVDCKNSLRSDIFKPSPLPTGREDAAVLGHGALQFLQTGRHLFPSRFFALLLRHPGQRVVRARTLRPCHPKGVDAALSSDTLLARGVRVRVLSRDGGTAVGARGPQSLVAWRLPGERSQKCRHTGFTIAPLTGVSHKDVVIVTVAVQVPKQCPNKQRTVLFVSNDLAHILQ